jgi:hypothetical protein
VDEFKFFLSATAILSMSFLEPATWAQDATGKIEGNITDPSGAVVPRATVIVTNLDTKTATQADQQPGFLPGAAASDRALRS